MTGNFNSHGRDAGYWVRRVDLNDLSGGLKTLVTPAGYYQAGTNIGNQPVGARDSLIIVTGFCYTFQASAANDGFILQSVNSRGGATWDIWKEYAQAAGNISFASGPIEWALRKAGYIDSPTVGDVADVLQINGNGSIAHGTFCVWGRHTNAEEYGPQAVGSPGSGHTFGV